MTQWGKGHRNLVFIPLYNWKGQILRAFYSVPIILAEVLTGYCSILTVALKKLKEQLTCSICLGTYTNPKLLQCHHAYCQQCLARLVQQDQQGQLTLTCPTCRQVTPIPASGVAGLRSDFRTNQLLEIAGEDWKKRETSVPENVEIAATSPKVESASASSLTPHENTTVCCPEHDGKEVTLYCETCGESICLKCVMKGGKHQSHVCEELDEVFEKCKKEISSSLAQLDVHCNEISNQRETIEADIHNTIIPDIRKTELISQLHQLIQAKLKPLAAQRDQIETVQVQLSRHLHSVSETSNEKEMLLMKSSAVRQAKELTTTLQPDMLNPSTEADIMLFDLVDIITQWKHGLVSAGPVDPSKCYAGKGVIVAEVGKKMTGLLQTVDVYNQPCSISTNSITCELVSENAVLQGSVERRGESQYKISYQPTIMGMHQLHIKVEGQHIRGSPFSVNVWSPEKMVSTPILTIGGVMGPRGVAINQKGEVVVAEGGRGGHCVTVCSSSGKKLRSFGTFHHNDDKYYNPVGVAVDNEENVLVADSVDHYIHKFTAQGKLLTVVSIKGDETDIDYPRGIAFNASNSRVYVVSGSRVQILNSDLSMYGTFGKRGSGHGQLHDPEHIACDSTGNVYVADRINHRIQVFTAEGKFLRVIAAGAAGRHGGGGKEQSWYPFGVAVDSSGRVYVSDNHVSVFTLEGQFVTSFGSFGSEPGQFRSPRGLAVDSNGVCYVCDQYNHHVQLFKIFN